MMPGVCYDYIVTNDHMNISTVGSSSCSTLTTSSLPFQKYVMAMERGKHMMPHLTTAANNQ